MKVGDELRCKIIGCRESITLNMCYTITELHDDCVFIKDDDNDGLWFTLDNNKYTGV